MSEIDINRYLTEVSPELPCGEYLEYDPEYKEMERLSQGVPERQYGDSISPAEDGDWRAVRKKALSLLNRSRDLYVAVFLAKSEARLGNLSGVSQSLALINGLLTQFWDELHPVRDPEDSYPILRMNVLSDLNDFERFIKPLRNIPLTASKTFPFGLRDYEVALGKIEVSETDEENKPTEAQLRASFQDSSKEQLQINYQYIEAMQNSLEDIKALTTEKVGANGAPSFDSLIEQLKEMRLVFDKYAELTVQDSVSAESSGVELHLGGTESELVASVNELNGGSNMPVITNISSREQVSEAIDLICGYFDINEPASPIPLLLKRAQGLLNKDFIEILQDLAPDSVPEAKKACGMDELTQD